MVMCPVGSRRPGVTACVSSILTPAATVMFNFFKKLFKLDTTCPGCWKGAKFPFDVKLRMCSKCSPTSDYAIFREPSGRTYVIVGVKSNKR